MPRRDFLIFGTRTVGRPMFKQFSKWLGAFETYAGQIDYRLLVNGQGQLEPEFQELVNTSLIRSYLVPGFAVSRLLLTGLRLAWGESFKYVGFLDDDAFIRDPKEFFGAVRHLFETRPDAGACGPLNGYIAWSKYENKIKPYQPVTIAGRPWVTFGMQIYRTEALNQASVERLLCCGIKFRCDLPMALYLDTKGWTQWEMLAPGFDHTCSGGIATARPDEAEMRRRRLQSAKDYAAMKKFFPARLELLEKMEKTEDRKYFKRVLECQEAAKEE